MQARLSWNVDDKGSGSDAGSGNDSDFDEFWFGNHSDDDRRPAAAVLDFRVDWPKVALDGKWLYSVPRAKMLTKSLGIGQVPAIGRCTESSATLIRSLTFKSGEPIPINPLLVIKNLLPTGRSGLMPAGCSPSIH